jgi:hypothetical protein
MATRQYPLGKPAGVAIVFIDGVARVIVSIWEDRIQNHLYTRGHAELGLGVVSSRGFHHESC